MLHFIIRLIVNAVALMIVAYLLPGVAVTGFTGALIAAFVLGIVNAILRPILVILTLPIQIVTLGLFTLDDQCCALLLGRPLGFGPRSARLQSGVLRRHHPRHRVVRGAPPSRRPIVNGRRLPYTDDAIARKSSTYRSYERPSPQSSKVSGSTSRAYSSVPTGSSLTTTPLSPSRRRELPPSRPIVRRTRPFRTIRR